MKPTETPPAVQDWTEGHPLTCIECCGECAHQWYFRRGFCPACGSRAVRREPVSGRGVVYAITTVGRAPSPEWRAIAPYDIALIDLAEGVRIMAHARSGLCIGDAVELEYLPMGDRLLPQAVPAATSD